MRRLFTVLLLTLLCAAARAASLADYNAALASLQAAAQSGNAAQIAAAGKAVQAISTVTVNSGPARPVDNRLLLASVNSAAAEKKPKLRTERLTQAAAQIATLRGALTSAPAPASKASPAELLRTELARPAYAADVVDPPSVSWLDRLSQRIGDWLRKLFTPKGPTPKVPDINPQFIKGILIFIAAGAFALLVAVLVKWLKGRPRRVSPLMGDEEELTLAEARDADSLRARAESEAARGDFRRAFRLIYLATLVALDTGGVLRFDRSRTNWEYLRALRAAGRDDVYQAMTPLTRAFDRVWYGFANADAGDYSRALAQYDALKAAPQSAAAAGAK